MRREARCLNRGDRPAASPHLRPPSPPLIAAAFGTAPSKPDAGGRATIDGLAPGNEFHAEVTVDGERLETATFPVPARGGVRTMLIAALGPATADEASNEAPAGAAPAGGAGQTFALGSA